MSYETQDLFNSDRGDLLRNFQQIILENKELQAKIRSCQTEEDVVRIAESFGLPVNVEDIKRLQRRPSAAAGPAELETVAGALPCWCDPSVVNTKSC